MQKSKDTIDQLVFKFAIFLLKHNTVVIQTPELIYNHISDIFLRYRLHVLKFSFVFIIFNFFRLKLSNSWNLANFKAILLQLTARPKNGPRPLNYSPNFKL